MILLQSALSTLAVVPAWGMLREEGRRRLLVLIGPLLLSAAAYGHGLPSIRGVREDLDRRCGARTADVLAAGCNFIAGDYWAVWPSVFHANLVLHDLGERRGVWGITFRSTPTRRLWKGIPRDEIRVAVPIGDTLAANWLRSYTFPDMLEAERRRTVTVLRPRPAQPK